jgi:hypothetical protein
MMKGVGGGIVAAIVGTIILIILSIIYFVITLFVVKASASIVFSGSTLSVDFAVLTAALITLGSMFGGAMSSRRNP